MRLHMCRSAAGLLSLVLISAVMPVLPLSVRDASGQAAASAQCACTAGARVTGYVRAASGNVLLLQASGYSPAAANDRLGPGSTMLAGPEGSAEVAFGPACSLTVPPNSELSVTPARPGLLCVKVSSFAAFAEPAASRAAAAEPPAGPCAPLSSCASKAGIALWAVGTGALIIALSDSPGKGKSKEKSESNSLNVSEDVSYDYDPAEDDDPGPETTTITKPGISE